jgi:hypothetical protein
MAWRGTPEAKARDAPERRKEWKVTLGERERPRTVNLRAFLRSPWEK